MLFFIKRVARAPQPPNNQQGTKWAKKFMCPKVHILGHTSPTFFWGCKSFDAQISENNLGKCCPLKGKNPVSSTLRALSFFCKARLFLFCARCSPVGNMASSKICLYPKSAPTGAFWPKIRFAGVRFVSENLYSAPLWDSVCRKKPLLASARPPFG